jgi:hypothetical protein
MDLFQTTFLSIFGVIVALIIFSIFTRRGRNFSVSVTFGNIIKDYGDIGNATKINGFIKQSVRLLQCDKKGEKFYLLETRTTAIMSF